MLRVVVFWIMMPLINWYHHFGGTCCWHLQGRRISYKDAGVSCNHWYRFYGTSYRNPFCGMALEHTIAVSGFVAIVLLYWQLH